MPAPIPAAAYKIPSNENGNAQMAIAGRRKKPLNPIRAIPIGTRTALRRIIIFWNSFIIYSLNNC
jgi:hypothetical protein